MLIVIFPKIKWIWEMFHPFAIFFVHALEPQSKYISAQFNYQMTIVDL